MKSAKHLLIGLAACVSAGVFGMGEEPKFAQATPVWAKGLAAERNIFLGFRAALDVKAGEKPTLRVTGGDDYRLSLDGKHIGWGPARAAKGHYRVDEIPLAVAPGRHILAIEVAGYNCYSYCLMNQPPFLQAEVVADDRVLAATGGANTFEVQRLPRVQKVARYSFQRPYGEVYRLTPGYDDWKKGVGSFAALPLEARPAVKLLPRRAPYADFSLTPLVPLSRAKTRFDAEMKTRPMRFVDAEGVEGCAGAFPKRELEINQLDLAQRFIAKDRMPVVAGASGLTFDAGDSMIFDAGHIDTGFPGFTVKCLKPGRIVFKFDEVLTAGEVSPTRYGCANSVVWDFEAAGEYDVEAFEPYAFRYADLIAASGAFEIAAPHIRTYKNPLAKRAKITCSDAALMKIFEAARETYAQNAADVFTDCPGRERAGWLCDSFFTGRSSVLFTGELDSESLFLENFALPEKFDFLPEGMFAMCYPADFPNGNFIPNWAMWLVFEVEEYKKRGGDPALIAAFQPRFEKLVEYLRTFRNADGLLEKLPKWVFVEWSQANRLVQDVNYPSNMMWAEVLDVCDRLYGRPEYAAEAARVRETVRRQSWTGKWFCDNAVRQKDGTLKLSGECTETCQYYAFFFRTATPETYPELWKTLVADFGPQRKTTGKHPQIWPSNAFIGNYLRLELLARENLAPQILNETRGFFLYMAEQTGTLWENIGATASCNHGFASHVAVSYARDILGLKAIDRVNRTVAFAPPKDLPLASIAMELPIGASATLRAGWKKVDGKVVEELVLPAGWSRR